MARRYDKGEIVGEPDAHKTLPETVQWLTEEVSYTKKMIDREENAYVLSYLRGRENGYWNTFDMVSVTLVDIRLEGA
jgi:hypothetical protein